jgi:hypothetical protein
MNVEVDIERLIFESGEAGYHWKVGPDPDGLGVQISYIEDGRTHTRLSFHSEVAKKIAKCILKCAEEVK